MSIQFDYDSSQYPPQPIVEVVIAAPESGASTPSLTTIVDAGADASLVPLNDLKPLAAPVGETRRVRSLWGERQEFKTFIVEVRIGNMILPGIEVLGYSGDEIVLAATSSTSYGSASTGPVGTPKWPNRIHGASDVKQIRLDGFNGNPPGLDRRTFRGRARASRTDQQ